jgi:PAS domain S-box-containing protein
MLFLPISLCTVNPANVIIDINRTLVDISGYKQDELMGSKIYLLFKDQNDIENLIKNTFDVGFVKNYEIVLLTKEKKLIPIVISTSLRRDDYGDIVGYFVTFMDISRLKQMEKMLKEKVKQLEKNKIAILNMLEDLQETIADKDKAEKEIKEKNLKLKKTQKMLKKLNKKLEEKVKERTAEVETLLHQKDAFINQLGHDLKSPLTPLVNILPIIEKTEDDPKSKKLIEVLVRNVNRMKNLVTKTLKLAQLNAPSSVLDLKDIYLWGSADNSIKDQQCIYPEKDFTIENKINENIFVRADKLRLSEVFDNLISNAIKYSPYGGNMTIDAQVIGGFVTVTVSDSGIGMTTEQINHIFDEFYKADQSRHDFDSSGLGLSICKRIVEKHGGRIWAESPGLEKGTTFYFTIPRSSKISKEDISE